MTVLSDSIHIGSMSPSSTIHFGPSWDKEDISLMVDEKRPKDIEMSDNTDVLHGHVRCHAHTITIFPLSCGGMQESEKLVRGHGFRVHVAPRGLQLHVRVGSMQRLQNLYAEV